MPGGCLTVLPRGRRGIERLRDGPRAVRARVGPVIRRAALFAVLAIALTRTLALKSTTTLLDRTNQSFFALIGQGEGLLATAGDFHRIQLMTRRAVLLDSAFRIPGTRIRFGLDAIVGLVQLRRLEAFVSSRFERMSYTDAIAALEKLGGLIRDAVQLPKRRRAQYLSAVTEAFSLLQAALILVETRLGDLLHIQDDWELSDDQKLRRFVQELANLDNTEQWLAMEADVKGDGTGVRGQRVEGGRGA